MSVRSCPDDRSEVGLHSGILFSHREESNVICKKIGENRANQTERREPGSERQLVFLDFI